VERICWFSPLFALRSKLPAAYTPRYSLISARFCFTQFSQFLNRFTPIVKGFEIVGEFVQRKQFLDRFLKPLPV
jgi:hypothetical protein